MICRLEKGERSLARHHGHRTLCWFEGPRQIWCNVSVKCDRKMAITGKRGGILGQVIAVAVVSVDPILVRPNRPAVSCGLAEDSVERHRGI
eukprot:scaffold92929_cov36-Tisochrysis_lutea.AAC.2